MEHRYWAFISYTSADRAHARWLQRRLERYRIPKTLVGRPGPVADAPRRLFPVFMDQEDMSIGPILSEAIKRELESAAFLVVVCSPAARDSKWVNREIAHFQSIGRAANIICVIVDGDPASGGSDSPFPPALFDGPFDSSLGGDLDDRIPLGADLRPNCDGRTRARQKVVARILGLKLYEITRSDARTTRRRRWLGASLASVVAVSLVGAAVALRSNARMAEARALTAVTTDVARRVAAGAYVDLGDIIGAAEASATLGERYPAEWSARTAAVLAGLLPTATVRTETRVRHVAGSADASEVYVVTDDGQVSAYRFDDATWRSIAEIDFSASDIATSPDGSFVVVSGSGGRSRTIDPGDVTGGETAVATRGPARSVVDAKTWTDLLAAGDERRSPPDGALQTAASADCLVQLVVDRGLLVHCGKNGEVTVESVDLPGITVSASAPARNVVAAIHAGGLTVVELDGRPIGHFDSVDPGASLTWLSSDHVLTFGPGVETLIHAVDSGASATPDYALWPGGEEGPVNERIEAVRIDPGGRHAVLTGRAGIYDWQAHAPRTLRFVMTNEKRRSGLRVAWKPDGTHWVTNQSDTTLRVVQTLWAHVSGTGASTDPLLRELQVSGTVSALAWSSSDRETIVVGTERGDVEFRDGFHTSTPRSRTVALGNPVAAIVPTASNDSFAVVIASEHRIDARTGGRDTRVLQLRARTGATFEARHGGAVTAAALDRDGRIVSAGGDLAVRTWAFDTAERRLVLEQTGGTRWAEWDRDREALLLVDAERDMLVWDTVGRRSFTLDPEEHVGPFSVQEAFWDPERSEDDRHVLAIGAAGSTVIGGWSVLGFRVDRARGVFFDDRRFLLPGDEGIRLDRSRLIGRSGDDEHIWRQFDDPPQIHDVRFVPDGASNEGKGILVSRERRSGATWEVAALDAAPLASGSSGDGSAVYASDVRGTTVWTTVKRGTSLVVTDDAPHVAAALDHTGSMLVVASMAGEIVVHDVASGSIHDRYQVTDVDDLAWSGDDEWIVSVSDDENAMAIGVVRREPVRALLLDRLAAAR